MQPQKLTEPELRKFGLTTGAIAAVLFGLLLPWIFGHRLPLWPWCVAGTLWLLALVYPKALQPIYTVWMKIGHGLG